MSEKPIHPAELKLERYRMALEIITQLTSINTAANVAKEALKE